MRYLISNKEDISIEIYKSKSVSLASKTTTIQLAYILDVPVNCWISLHRSGPFIDLGPFWIPSWFRKVNITCGAFESTCACG